jgi:hypothetical protein
VADLKDFSSFDPDQEKAFVPFESAMKTNEGRANRFGLTLAISMFVVGSFSVVLLYTPCSRFCEHPPASCKTDQEVADFKRICTTHCRALEAEQGLSIVRETKNQKTGQMEDHTDKVDGTEYVDNLASCAFSGGGGVTCEGITKYAATKGLWCLDKK